MCHSELSDELVSSAEGKVLDWGSGGLRFSPSSVYIEGDRRSTRSFHTPTLQVLPYSVAPQPQLWFLSVLLRAKTLGCAGENQRLVWRFYP